MTPLDNAIDRLALLRVRVTEIEQLLAAGRRDSDLARELIAEADRISRELGRLLVGQNLTSVVMERIRIRLNAYAQFRTAILSGR